MEIAKTRPTESEWLEKKKELELSYLVHGHTTERIKAVQETKGFSASIRQYKQKWHQWGFDKKNIRHPTWVAMHRVLKERAVPCQFYVRVRNGNETRIVTAEQISKHMIRAERRNRGKRRHSHQNISNHSPQEGLEDEDTEEILRREGITVEELQPRPECLMDSPGMPHPTINRVVQPDAVVSTEPSNSGGSLTLNTASDEFRFRLVPRDVRNSLDLGSRHVYDSRVSTPPVHLVNTCRLDQHLEHGEQSLKPDHGTKLLNKDYDHEEFGLATGLASVSLKSDCKPDIKNAIREYLGANIYKSIPLRISDECTIAIEWAEYYILQCLTESDTPDSRDSYSRQRACQQFAFMLTRSNPFIFAYTHWIGTVFSSNDKSRQLEDFLRDCSRVVGESGVGFADTHGIPFRFMLAVHLEETSVIDSLGERLVQTDKKTQIAWHHLRMGRVDDAVNVLHQTLPIAESLLGRCHTMTITCLAMFSRTYEDKKDYQTAISYVCDALARLHNPPHPLQAYRYCLLRQLATLLMQLHDHENAESLFRTVMEFRAAHIGYASGSTWAAIKSLCTLLETTGRSDEARNLEARMTALHDEEVRRRHIQRYGFEPGWICQICNRPKEFADCCHQSGSSRR